MIHLLTPAFPPSRYLKILHPYVLQTVRTAHIISAITWIFLLATMSTYITLSLVTQEALPAVPSRVSCDVLHSEQLNLFYKIIHIFSAATFILVVVSLVFFYLSISCRLWLAELMNPASSGSKKLAKSRRNMLVLVSVFCLCFVPYHLVRLPYVFLSRQCSGSQVIFYLKELTIMLSVLNICLDPLIYFIFCKVFRAQLSLRKVSSTMQVTMRGGNPERRTIDEHRMSANKTNRKLSLSTVIKHNDVLWLEDNRL